MKIRSRCFQTLAVVLSLTMVFSVNAEDLPDIYDAEEGIVDTPWQEQNESLPELPKAQNLLPFTVVNRDYDNYRYAIDSTSLSIGEHDGVRRFLVVITSESGVRNLRYEGIRCETAEYKTYAYAVGESQLRAYSTAKWQRIIREGSGRYRYTLFDNYFCSHYDTNTTVAEILQALRYPIEESIEVFE